MKERTALIRDFNGNLKILRGDDYRTQAEMREDLTGNGYKVLKIWNGYKTDVEVDEWEYLNRK